MRGMERQAILNDGVRETLALPSGIEPLFSP